jgi:hypothetical protein
MESYVGFINDKTNESLRPPTMTGLFTANFLSSSHMVPDLMDRSDAYAGVVWLLKKGRRYP